MGKYCTNCGSQLKDGAKFCSSCGSPVENDVAENTVPQNISGVNIEEEQRIQPELSKANEKPKNISGCGYLIAVLIALIIIVVGIIGSSSASGGISTATIDKLFIDRMNTTVGGNFAYTISDHSTRFEDSLKEYIGTGSFSDSSGSYTYNFRAITNDGKVNFVKVYVEDDWGNQVLHYYDEEMETAHLDKN